MPLGAVEDTKIFPDSIVTTIEAAFTPETQIFHAREKMTLKFQGHLRISVYLSCNNHNTGNT